MAEGIGGLLMWLGFALFPVVTVLYIAWEIRNMWRDSPAATPKQPGPDRALAILRERYARGEIDRAEYEERLLVLATPSRRLAAWWRGRGTASHDGGF